MLEPTTYPSLEERLLRPVDTEPFAAPDLIAWNAELAERLGLAGLDEDPATLARAMSGNETLPGSRPVALAYAGHQFGTFVPSLGDGRALLLGEVTATDGRRYDLQLKGSGRTPFSRGGDGRSALGPVIREYLVSEAMHVLGVPTTRALAAVRTGEQVIRERLLPGAVLARVAASHLRVGTFEYFAARGDSAAIEALVAFAIQRHYPELAEFEPGERPTHLLRAVAGRQAELIARWMSVGFIHGVMNTDNTTLSGETLDYGPCAFIDEFRRDKVFSSIDRGGRYSYGNQPRIAQWNLARLADCLLLVTDDRQGLTDAVSEFADRFADEHLTRMGRKLGLLAPRREDAALVEAFLLELEEQGLDFTVSFRALAGRVNADDDARIGSFETRWRERLSDEPGDVRALIESVNPAYIPRNHQVEAAIVAAESGDFAPFHALSDVLAAPFTERAGLEAFAEPPREDERIRQTFCGT